MGIAEFKVVEKVIKCNPKIFTTIKDSNKSIMFFRSKSYEIEKGVVTISSIKIQWRRICQED
jgi:hypothetical protein